MWHVGWAEVQDTYYRHIGSQRSGKRWLIALINKVWLTSWDLWEDRNGVNADRRDAAGRLVLLARVTAEFRLGHISLHRKSRRLFTDRSELVLLGAKTQTLESWLLRVDSARIWAALEPEVVRQEQLEDAARAHRKGIREAAQRMQTRMQTMMSNWLRRDQEA
jgi:hypothetical protein